MLFLVEPTFLLDEKKYNLIYIRKLINIKTLLCTTRQQTIQI